MNLLKRSVVPSIPSSADETHLMFLSLGGMEGLHSADTADTVEKARGWRAIHRLYPGILMAVVTAIAAKWISQHYSAPVMLFALLLGIAFHFLYQEARCTEGIEFVSRTILRLGVALLGARITVNQIFGLGVAPVLIAVCALSTTIAVGVLGARWLRLRPAFGLLSGGAVGICGASAAMAIASILPQTRETERDTILTVVSVTALSTLAMIIYPLIATYLNFSSHEAGIFLGGSIHDVAQVVGAGFTISPETGDVATYVKLLRVALLLPAVFVIALIVAQKDGEDGARRPAAQIPMFLLGFAILVVVRSIGWLPHQAVGAISDISSWCLVIAIAAIGMKTSLANLAAVGVRPIMLIIAETFWIAALVLAAIWCLS